MFGTANQVKTPVVPAYVNNNTPAKSNAFVGDTSVNNEHQMADSADYWVQSVKPSGEKSQLLELVNNGGKVVAAYIKNGDASIKAGAMLEGVNIVQMQSTRGAYNLINNYRIAA